jgi:response regulator RpfG family c-di-GMP phosphodiesterase
VVHPQPEALGELAELVGGLGLIVETARSAVEANNKLQAQQVHVIIASHLPPAFDGVAFVERSGRMIKEALRILLVSNANEGVELERPRQSGGGMVMRLVARPNERSRLVAMVSEGVKLLQLLEEERELVRNIRAANDRLRLRETLLDVVVKERTKELEESYEKLKRANRQALFGLAEAIEAKDPYTKGHCGRVAAYSLVLAKESGYADNGLETLEFGAFLHDIGKIGIRDAVLLKPGPLDDNEWVHMREHPVKGDEIASKIEMLQPIMPAVRNHHERWDGTGYPDKMRGEGIPLVARIVAIADAYDAMSTDRPYKKSIPIDVCEKLLRQHAGKMYDPDLIEVFVTKRLGLLFREDYEGLPYEDGYTPVLESAKPTAPPAKPSSPSLASPSRDE